MDNTLEQLREQYGTQLVALRAQLDKERSQLGTTHKEPPATSSATQAGEDSHGQEEEGTAQGGDNNDEEVFKLDIQPPDFNLYFRKRLDELTESLSADDKDVLSRLAPRLCDVYTIDMDTWLKTHKSEIQLHVEAMRLTVTQVYSSQMALLQEELESQKAAELRDQHEELTAEYHQNLEMLQHELEELEERTGLTPEEVEIKVMAQVEEQHALDLAELRAELEEQIRDNEFRFNKELTDQSSRYEEELKQLRDLTERESPKDDATPDTNVGEKDFEQLAVVPTDHGKDRLMSPADLDRSDASTFTSDLQSQGLIAELQQEIDAYRNQIETFKEQANEELENLQNKHDEEIEIMNEKHENELLEKVQKMEESFVQSLKSMEFKIQNMKDNHFAEVEDLQGRISDYEDQMQEMEESRDMDDYTTGLNVNTLEDEIERLTDELNEREDEIIAIKEKSKSGRNLDKELDILTEELTTRDREIVGLKKKLGQSLKLADDVERLIEELTIKDYEIVTLKKAAVVHAVTADELHKLKTSLKDKEEALEDIEDEKDTLNTTLTKKDEEINKMRGKLAQTVSMDEEIDRLGEQLHVATSELELSALRRTDSVQELEDTRKVLATRDEELSIVKREMAEKHRLHVEKLMDDLSSQHQEELDKLHKEVRELKDQITTSGSTGTPSGDDIDHAISSEHSSDGKTHTGDELDDIDFALDEQEKEPKQDLEEMCIQLEARRIEEVENLKLDMERRQVQEHEKYTEMMRKMDDELQERIEKEVKNTRRDMEKTMEQELEVVRDTLKDEYEEIIKMRDIEIEKLLKERKKKKVPTATLR